MKTFEEYINGRGYSWNDFDRTYEMEHLIEQYADEKVKLALDTSSVVVSYSNICTDSGEECKYDCSGLCKERC
jgi:hypothetical protein